MHTYCGTYKWLISELGDQIIHITAFSSMITWVARYQMPAAQWGTSENGALLMFLNFI